MIFNKPAIFYNITKPIDSAVTYPGDTPFLKECITSLEKGDAFSLHHIHMSNHVGTHVDYPSHFIKGGKTSSDFSLDYFMGRCLVIGIESNHSLIYSTDLVDQDIQSEDFVFFKTTNSAMTDFSEKYTALDITAAKYLVDKKVKIVGIDYLSVDAHNDSGFAVHHELLSHNGPIQAASATVTSRPVRSRKTSLGVLNPKTSLGRLFNLF